MIKTTIYFVLFLFSILIVSCKKEDEEGYSGDTTTEGGCFPVVGYVSPSIITIDSTNLQTSYQTGDSIFLQGFISGNSVIQNNISIKSTQSDTALYVISINSDPDGTIPVDTVFYLDFAFSDTLIFTWVSVQLTSNIPGSTGCPNIRIQNKKFKVKYN